MAATAIIIPAPGAEALVGAFRREHTEEGAHGMGAHVTLLFPFTDTTRLDEHRVDAAAELLAGFPAFDFSFAALGRFPENPRVLCLRPDPAAPFRAMTRALVAVFPEHQPYDGKYADPAPHATVAIGDAPILDAIFETLAPSVPIAERAIEATLVEQDAGATWRVRRRLPLGD